ncbi:MAG TPA: SDR family oxidoreductase [Anaerolineales bacterium]|nr:SDR family oxidoreductase [Anaerolineales bacterium]
MPDSDRKTILVTGASGLLGANLVLSAKGMQHVVAACNSHPLRSDGFKVAQADLRQPGVIQRVIASSEADWVIHCAALTDVDRCEAEPELAYRLNRDLAGWAAEGAAASGARLVHISTDAVFDGERGGYREGDPARPINVYGHSKLEGERAVLDACPGALIVRTNIFGWNAQPKQSLAEWFLGKLEGGQRCSGFSDVYVTPILVNDLADLLLRLLETGKEGLLHVVGKDCVSKLEFGLRIADVFGLESGLLEPADADSVGLRARRPRRLCLDGTEAEAALGHPLPGLDDAIRRFHILRTNGYRDRLRRMLELGSGLLPETDLLGNTPNAEVTAT